MPDANALDPSTLMSAPVAQWLALQRAKNTAEGSGDDNLLNRVFSQGDPYYAPPPPPATPLGGWPHPVWSPDNPVGTSVLHDTYAGPASPSFSPLVTRPYADVPITAAKAAEIETGAREYSLNLAGNLMLMEGGRMDRAPGDPVALPSKRVRVPGADRLPEPGTRAAVRNPRSASLDGHLPFPDAEDPAAQEGPPATSEVVPAQAPAPAPEPAPAPAAGDTVPPATPAPAAAGPVSHSLDGHVPFPDAVEPTPPPGAPEPTPAPAAAPAPPPPPRPATVRLDTPGGEIVRVGVRGPRNVLQDVRPKTAGAIGDLLDAHLAHGDVPLAGAQTGEGGTQADINVTLPPGIKKASDIADRSRDMVSRATLMTQNVPAGMSPPRYWYRDGAGALHVVTGNDLDATERLAAGHAVTSPQADVFGNSNLAVNAWNQSILGQPLQVRTGDQNAALEEVLYGNKLPETRKTGPFFENHVRYLDPTWGKKITNDIWQMRDAGFTNADGSPYSGTPTAGEDNYVRMMVDRATRQLNAAGVDGGGWVPDQVQAALWTHAKTEQETGSPSSASVNFKNALERLQMAQVNAHRPGPALIANPQDQAAFLNEAKPHLVDQYGRDLVNSGFGMLTPANVPGGGVVAITADGIKQSSRDLMNASTLTRATLLRQPDAFWSAHPDVKGLPTIANANVVKVPSGSPEDYRHVVGAALDRAGGGLERAHIDLTPAGPRILNIRELTGMDNPTFQAAVKDAMRKAGLQTADLTRARADYGYFHHDWAADPTGSRYVAELGRLPPHLQRVGDQLLAQLGGRIDAAASQVSGSQGNTGPWRLPGFAQAVGPVGPLPLRPWVSRPSQAGPGSALPNLLGLARPP